MAHRQILKAFTGLLLALLVAMLSSTIVTNALPTILADLDGTQSQYTWVVTAMLLTSTATTPIWGKLSDLFSKKLLYQLAIVIFTVGSVLGGFAQSMPELIAYRALQGLGLGGLQALIQAVMAAMIAPRDRGKYSGYIGAVFAVATVSGPLLGGVIVDSALGWRWCFWVCVPIAILAFIVLGRTLHLPVLKRDVKVDWLGATLIVGGVALLLIWVSLAGKNFPWWSWETASFVGGALAALALALAVEAKVREPVVPLRLFRNSSFSLAVLGTLAVGTAMFGGAVFLGQYYQLARGYSPTHAGLMTLPMVLGLALSSTISGQVVSRIGRTKPFLLGGSVLLVAALFLLSTIDHTTNLTLMGCYLALMGMGVGALMQNLVLVAQNTVGMRDMGSSTAVVTFFRTLGGSAGVSALGAVLANQVSGGNGGAGGGSLDLAALPPEVREAVRAAYGDGTGTIFLISAITAVVILLAVLFLRETPLRSTLDTGTEAAPERAPLAMYTVELSGSPVRRDIVLSGAGAVSGRIRGARHRAVGGATVVLTDARGDVLSSGLSGGDGWYQFPDVIGGSYTLAVTARGHRPQAVPISLVDGEQLTRDVELAPSGQVLGAVRSGPSGQTVAEAQVTLLNAEGQVVAVALTDAEGSYRFGDLDVGEYTIIATGYALATARLTVVGEGNERQDVELGYSTDFDRHDTER